MDNVKKGRLNRKKVYIIVLSLSVILLIFLIVFIYLYSKSPSFLTRVERIIESRIQRPVEIGSISLAQVNEIIIRDFIIKEKDEGDPLIILPYLKIQASPFSLLNKSIREITLQKPKLFLALKKDRRAEAGMSKPSLPFTLKKISIEDGEVILKRDNGKFVHINSVTLLLEEAVHKKKSKITGKAFISELNSTVSVEAVVDMNELDIERGHIDISMTDLEDLSSENLLIFSKDRRVKGSINMSLDIERVKDFLTNGIGWQSEISIHNLSIHSDTLGVNLKNRPLRLFSKGAYNFKTDSIEIEFIKVWLARLQLLTLRGSLNKAFSGNPGFNLKAEAKEIPLNDVKGLIDGSAVTWLDSLDIEGNGEATLSITGNLKAPQVKGVVYLKGERLKRETIEFESFDIRLPVEYGRDAWIFRKPVITVKDAAICNFSKKNGCQYRLKNIDVMIPYLEYKNSSLQSGVLELKVDRAVIYRSGKEYYKEEGIYIKGVIEGNLDRHWLQLKDISLDTGSIKGFAGNISLVLGKPVTIETVVKHKNIDLQNVWTKVLNRFSKENGFSVHGNGKVHSEFTITMPENAASHVIGNADVSITQGGFSSPDATKIGEGIDMNVSGSFKFSLPLSTAEFAINTEAAGFELLMGKFYGDFKERALNFFAKGKYTRSNDTLNVSFSELRLADIGSVLISGDIVNLTESPRFNTEVNLVTLSNRKAYDFFLRETFQDSFPVLSQLEIDGKTSVILSVRGTSDRFDARGDIKVVDMDILKKNPDISVQGVNISLPVNVSYPEVSFSKEIERFGYLKVQDVSWEGLHLNDLEAFPVIWQNDLIFKGDIFIPIFGGSVRLKDINYSHLFSPQRELTLSISIDGIDLAQASNSLKIPRFIGNLSGVIPKASIVGSSLLTEGEIVMELFGGGMRVDNFSVNNVFGPVPSLKISVEIQGIDLNKLTETFEFGHISGIMQGYVKDLVIVKGQAESFNAFIETVKRKGISQRISVEALKKISIIGSGSSASLLSTGIYRFFKEYRYEKMGFKGSLRNDNFLLLGVEAEGNKQYIVKGGFLPPRVDVISYTQNISFQEMVKRLKRIRQMGKEEK